MTRDYYELPKSSSVMRFLWKCAGGDRYLLERATYSDQIKYMCLGGIVFATGAMAGLAGGYAFYTIFSPKTADVLDKTNTVLENPNYIPTDIPTLIFSVLFGIVWGLIIFNIDRFIVTSTGKGDGTEEITWLEFKTAIPRILMGLIIAITISKPIEIRMFQTEINVELYKLQKAEELKMKEATSKISSPDIERINKDLKNIDDLNNELIKNEGIARKDLRDCLMKLGGDCPQNTKLYNESKKAREDFEKKNKPKIIALEAKKANLQGGKEEIEKVSQNVASGLDGLSKRIQLAHEVAGFWISLFITLLFMAIELTPIFFKLMLTKTTYDYLAENRDDLIKADYGIEVQYDKYKDKEGVERHLVINHEAEKLIYEKIKVTEIQKRLTDYAIQKYEEREKKKIDENLDNYISSINKNEEKA
jgi:Domain of unknown function (DUF4407)